jgi:hypothetical protein
MRAKPTDQHRNAMAAATNTNPKARVIEAQLVEPANLLAERGYINLQSLPDGRYQVEVTDLARERSRNLRGWRRYPPLRPRPRPQVRRPSL